MNIELTENQIKALNIAKEHFREGKDTVIAGYAGTGKSTLVSYLIEEFIAEGIINSGDYTFAAFTGKAAQVLTNKGCPACTLHKLLYDVKIDDKGNVHFIPKMYLDYSLIVIDECSMLPLDMYELLKTYNVSVIFLGDPGQLPSLDEKQNNHLLDHPDIFLTEVLRQAQNSGIIKLSMMIRNHENFNNFRSKEAMVISKREFDEKFLTRADVVLVATNKERRRINNLVRSLLGKTGLIDKEEKIICTQNYWEADIPSSLTNGCVGTLHSFTYDTWKRSKRSQSSIKVIKGSFDSEFGLHKYVTLDEQFLREETPSLDLRTKIKTNKGLLPKEFSYGYALTGHKSQGSEFDSVIVMEENFPFDTEDHTRWLYTCVTRAKKKVILVRSH